MKILILIFFFEIKESKITRGPNFMLVKNQSRLDVRKFSFSQRTINVWNKLSTECVRASSVNIYIIKERLETYSGMESYLPNSDRHAASWIFSDGPTKPTGVVKLRYNALELFFDNVAI